MNADTKSETQTDTAKTSSHAETVVGFAVLGLLAAGTVGVIRAASMDSGFGVMLCLIASVAAFGSVYYICYGKH